MKKVMRYVWCLIESAVFRYMIRPCPFCNRDLGCVNGHWSHIHSLSEECSR